MSILPAFRRATVRSRCDCGMSPLSGGGGEAARLELFGEFHRGLLGAREHQHAVEGLGLEDACQRIQLVHAAHQPVALADVGGGAGLAAGW